MVRPIDNILKSASIGPALSRDVRAALIGLAHCARMGKEWYAIVVSDTCGDDQRQGAIRMASIPDAVVQSVKRFLAAVQQQRRIEAAYVYGSQVKGTAT
jgi:hypothetical protein